MLNGQGLTVHPITLLGNTARMDRIHTRWQRYRRVSAPQHGSTVLLAACNRLPL